MYIKYGIFTIQHKYMYITIQSGMFTWVHKTAFLNHPLTYILTMTMQIKSNKVFWDILHYKG